MISRDHSSAFRWEQRGMLWEWSGLQRVRACGKWPKSGNEHGEIGVRLTADGKAGFSGLQSCGSIWACPVCNAKIQAHRRLELGVALSNAERLGLAATFGAMTIRHGRADRLDDLWRDLSYCWARVTRDKGVARLRKEIGRVGYVRATEVTHGRHGWHPHVHPLTFFERRGRSDAQLRAEIERLHDHEFRAWVAAAKSRGLSAPLDRAQHWHLVQAGDIAHTLDDYFTKATAVRTSRSVRFEMTGDQLKRGREGTDGVHGRTPWEILADMQGHEVDDDGVCGPDFALWREYEDASKGKRALLWSRGLRDLLGVGAETDDEDVAAEEVGDADDTLFVVTDWSRVVAQPRVGGLILDRLRTDGLLGALRVCEQHDVPVRLIER